MRGAGDIELSSNRLRMKGCVRSLGWREVSSEFAQEKRPGENPGLVEQIFFGSTPSVDGDCYVGRFFCLAGEITELFTNDVHVLRSFDSDSY